MPESSPYTVPPVVAETSGVIFNAAQATWKCDGMALAPALVRPRDSICATLGNTKHEANLLWMNGSLFT
jgi:hypothetical protein